MLVLRSSITFAFYLLLNSAWKAYGVRVSISIEAEPHTIHRPQIAVTYGL